MSKTIFAIKRKKLAAKTPARCFHEIQKLLGKIIVRDNFYSSSTSFRKFRFFLVKFEPQSGQPYNAQLFSNLPTLSEQKHQNSKLKLSTVQN